MFDIFKQKVHSITKTMKAMMRRMAEEVKLLENELLEKLRNVKKRIEEFEELIKKYGIDDPDVNSELYFFVREDLLNLT